MAQSTEIARSPRKPSTIEAAVQKNITRFHIWVYRTTAGRIGQYIGSVPCLLLTSTGRKTGKQRTTPLTYLQDGDRYVLVASNGGTLTDPVWWLNLQSQPRATIQVGNLTLTVQATMADSTERTRLWPQAVAVYSGYAGYQRRTPREIPMVILSPIPS